MNIFFSKSKQIHALLFVAIQFASNAVFCQNKEITLHDAVMTSASGLSPRQLTDLQWISDTHSYSYLSEDQKAVWQGDIGSQSDRQLITVEEVNALLDKADTVRTFTSITWLDNKTFSFFVGGKQYEVDPFEKKIGVIRTLPVAATNFDLDKAGNMLAFTVGPDVGILDQGTSVNMITSNRAQPDREITSGSYIARVEFGISKGTFWSPKGNYLAYYEKDESKVDDYPLLNVKNIPGALKSIKYPMAGQSSEFPGVGVFNLSSGSKVYLQTQGAKDHYVTNLAWDPTEQFLYLAEVNRDQDHMWLNKYNASTGAFVQTLFEEAHARWVEPEKPPFFLSGDPSKFVWMSERDGFMNLYLYDTAMGLIRKLTDNRWVASEILGEDATGQYLVLTGTGENPMELQAFKVHIKSGKMMKITEAPGVHDVHLSDDGKYLIDHYTSMQNPGRTSILEVRSGKEIKTILSSGDPLMDYQRSDIEIVNIQADDGTTLYGRLIKPSNFTPDAKYPVLVYVYGGPHAQLVTNEWLAGARLWMLHQAEKGCLVFTLDNRGSQNRGFEFESVIHRQLGSVEINDQIRGIEYLTALPYVDADRMAVHGWSYGGFMTLSLMLRKPGVFKVGVAGGPVTDWRLYEVMYGERYMDRPSENPDGYAASRLANYAENLDGSILMVHGAMDSTVVMQHSYELLDAFIDANRQVDFFVYPNHPHNVRGMDRVHLMNKILLYIDEKLGIK